SGHSAQERSDIYEPACTVPLSSLERERHTGRWHATRASSYEGPHIRLCYPIPHHVTRINVSTFAHSRFRKGQVGDAVRNQINLFCWNSKYILQKPGRVLAHNNQTIRARGDFLQDDKLVNVWLTKNRMQSCHHWHFEVLQQPQDMAAGLPSINSVLMLQTHQIDIAGIKEVGGCFIG